MSLFPFSHGFMMANSRRPLSPVFTASKKTPISVDVSDLNLTMNDLERPLDWASMETIGSSSSRDYYKWKETKTDMFIIFKHPGTRGQPAAAIDVKLTATTLTVTIFGYAVWSGILQNQIDVSRSTFEAIEGQNYQPIINIRLCKSVDILWNEFISSVGVDSVLQ